MKRQPEGIPAGGQFAAERKLEPVGALTVDASTMDWDLTGDEYADVHSCRVGNTEVSIVDDMRSETPRVTSSWHFGEHGSVEINYLATSTESAKKVAAAVIEENNADHGLPSVPGGKTRFGKIVACDSWAPGMECIYTDRVNARLYKLSESRNNMVPEHLRAKHGLYVSGAIPVLYGSAAADSQLARDLLPEFKKSNPVDYFRLLTKRPELRPDAAIEDR